MTPFSAAQVAKPQADVTAGGFATPELPLGITRLYLGVVLLLLLSISPRLAAQQAGDSGISHGPILGRPGATEMAVWARTAAPGAFFVHYGADENKLDAVSDAVVTRLETDNTGWALLKGLKPDSKYYYQVSRHRDRSTGGAAGTFRTLPSADTYRHAAHNPRGLFNLTFEAGSCANQGEHSLGPSLPAYGTMLRQAADRVQFAIMNGDWLYENKREFSADAWLKQVGAKKEDAPRVLKLAPAIAGVWENYKSYLEDGKNLAAWHTRVPSFYTFDDHEILNDVVACGEPGKRDRRTVFRDPAVEAWYHYLAWANPVEYKQGIQFGRGQFKAGSDVLTDPEADFTKLDLAQAANLHVHWGTATAGINDPKLDGAGGDPNAGVYEIVQVLSPKQLRIRPAADANGSQTYSIGRRSYYRYRASNCEFYFLDTRTHRQQHDIKQPNKPGVSMLGQTQKEWLMKGMAASDADFLFVVTSVPFTIPHNDAGGMAVAAADKDDAWTAFVDEREQLIRHWDGLGKPVIVLTGDLHNSFVIRISDRVWEFCCGPHNSRNHPLNSEGRRPINGVFDSKGRKCDIRWSTFMLDEVPQQYRHRPNFCIVQINNIYSNQVAQDETVWVAYPRPQAIFQYHDGLTGQMLYAESVLSGK